MLKCYDILQALFQSDQHIYEKREGSGSTPLTNGSGSERPKNLRIRIRFRIRSEHRIAFIQTVESGSISLRHRSADPDPTKMSRIHNRGSGCPLRVDAPLSPINFYVIPGIVPPVSDLIKRDKLLCWSSFLCAVYCWGPADQVQVPCQWPVRQRRLRQDPGLVEGEVRSQQSISMNQFSRLNFW